MKSNWSTEMQNSTFLNRWTAPSNVKRTQHPANGYSLGKVKTCFHTETYTGTLIAAWLILDPVWQTAVHSNSATGSVDHGSNRKSTVLRGKSSGPKGPTAVWFYLLTEQGKPTVISNCRGRLTKRGWREPLSWTDAFLCDWVVIMQSSIC
jgi:hypothetical protein